jgi:hypothetical protein
MTYSFPSIVQDPALQEARDIAMSYLEFTGQAYPYWATERVCALTILNEWRWGKQHRIWLAKQSHRSDQANNELGPAEHPSDGPWAYTLSIDEGAELVRPSSLFGRWVLKTGNGIIQPRLRRLVRKKLFRNDPTKPAVALTLKGRTTT